MSAVDWQTAKARAIQDVKLITRDFFSDDMIAELITQALKSFRDSGYPVVRASDPPVHVRDAGFQAHANGGPKAFGMAYEVMVREMAKETAE